MSLKKVTYLAKQFSIKLAQKPKPTGINPGELPFGGAANPYGSDAPFGGTAGDPMAAAKKELGALTEPEEYNRFAPAPAKSQTAFSLNAPHTGAPNDQFSTIRKMLDIGLPGTKGILRLVVNGNNITPMYNRSRWRVKPDEAHRMLMNALSPKYTVDKPIGYINPDWSFNSDPEHTFMY